MENIQKKYPQAIILMENGNRIVIELRPDHAPNTVNSFIYAAEHGYFDQHVIERIVPKDWIDVSYTGFRKEEGQYLIPYESKLHPELEPLDSHFGCICMGGYGEMGESGCEFFFPLRDCPEHKGIYPVFGEILEGKEELIRLKGLELEPVTTYPDPNIEVNRPKIPQKIERVEIIRNGYEASKPIRVSHAELPNCWLQYREENKKKGLDMEKLKRVLDSMKKNNLPQMIISDPVAIFYLTGKWIHPGERMLALYLNVNGNHKLVINELFPQEEDLGIELIWYNDVQDAVEILSHYVEKDKLMGIDKNWPARFLLRLQELGGGSRFINSSYIVDYVRMIKDEKEQARMRRSSLVNDQVMEQLIPLVNQGYTERELNSMTKDLYKKAGCEDVSFDPITAFAKGAADPHHMTDDSRGKWGDCVVLDIGGLKDDYASDMTRTVFLGEVSNRQREIYNIVLEANLRGIAAAKPGARMCDVDRACRDYIESMGFGKYFIHRTGHSIGLEDHEFGDVSSVNEDVIRVGQCFSVEPGIYIPEEEIGVRIEDLVLITEDGCEVLNHFTKDLIVLPFEKQV